MGQGDGDVLQLACTQHQAMEPSLPGIRVARPSDLPRIGLVAASGFYHSPVFQYQRPYHAHFPEDTLCSYLEEYRTALLAPDCIVIVAEDVSTSSESDYIYPALRDISTDSATQPNISTVVGVASLMLPKDSWSHGRYNVEGRLTEALAAMLNSFVDWQQGH
jgi:hypothetical protein